MEALRQREGYKFSWASETLEKMGKAARPAIPVLEEIANDPTRKQTHRESARESIQKIRRE